MGTETRQIFSSMFVMKNKCRSLDYAHSNGSIICSNDLCKPIEIYISMLGKSAHLQVIQQQSTQYTANLPLQTYYKNQWTFFIV